MNFLKNIPTIAFSLLFVVTTIVFLFGAGKVVDAGLRYLLDASMIVCEPYYPTEGRSAPPIPVKGEPCHQDVRFLKERLAEGLSMTIIAGPLAFLFWRRIRNEGNS